MRIPSWSVFVAVALSASLGHAGPKSNPVAGKGVDTPIVAVNPVESVLAPDVIAKLDVIARTTVKDKLSYAAALGHEIAARDVLASRRFDARHLWYDDTTHLRVDLRGRIDPLTNVIALADSVLGTPSAAFAGLGGTIADDSPFYHDTLRLRFQAAATRHYLIDCTVAGGEQGEPRISASASASGEAVTASQVARNGHLVLFIAAAAERRPISLLIGGDRPWVTDGCEVTPLRE